MAAWRRSARCNGGACVEVGQGQAVIGIRDTKAPDGPVLTFDARAWERFTASLKADLLPRRPFLRPGHKDTLARHDLDVTLVG